MRKVTREEAAESAALAREHGFLSENGDIAVGRFKLVSGEGIEFITPVAAPLYSPDLQRKQPPILFDRTPSGEIILPGRWWAHMFERGNELEGISSDDRRAAALMARHGEFSDILLPAERDTIEFALPDESGQPVVYEALPPGTLVRLRIVPKGAKQAQMGDR